MSRTVIRINRCQGDSNAQSYDAMSWIDATIKRILEAYSNNPHNVKEFIVTIEVDQL